MNPKYKAILRRAMRDGKDLRQAVLKAFADDTTAVLANLPDGDDPGKLAVVINLIDAMDMEWVGIYRYIPNAKIGDYEKVIMTANPKFAHLWKEDSVAKVLVGIKSTVQKVMSRQ